MPVEQVELFVAGRSPLAVFRHLFEVLFARWSRDARCRAFLSGIWFQGWQLVEPSAQIVRQDDRPPSALSRDQFTGFDRLIN